MGPGARDPLSVLVDTHCLIWWFGDRLRLSPTAIAVMEDADRILISPISWWEIGLLVRDDRIRLDRPLGHWIATVMGDRRSGAAALTPEAAAWAGSLEVGSFPGDSADRLIYATARDLRIPLISKDGRLHEHAAGAGDVEVIW